MIKFNKHNSKNKKIQELEQEIKYLKNEIDVLYNNDKEFFNKFEEHCHRVTYEGLSLASQTCNLKTDIVIHYHDYTLTGSKIQKINSGRNIPIT